MVLDSCGYKAAIIVCEALAEEMSIVAVEKGIPFILHTVSSQCHRDPQTLKCRILEAVDLFKEQARVFIAYGGCSSFDHAGLDGVYALNAHNCASVLLGGDSRYQKMVMGSYFLTPYLSLHWMEYFLGKPAYAELDPKTAKHLKKWFKPIERLIKIDIRLETREIESASAIKLSELIEKPLVYVEGSLELLRHEYESFCCRHFNKH